MGYDLKSYSPLGQTIAAVGIGILLSPYSAGIIWFLIFIILYEALYYYYTGGTSTLWQSETRIGVIFGSIFGWLLGRQFVLTDVFGIDPPNHDVDVDYEDVCNLIGHRSNPHCRGSKHVRK